MVDCTILLSITNNRKISTIHENVFGLPFYHFQIVLVEMITKFFILNIFAVTLVESASVAVDAASSVDGVHAGPFKILCDHDAGDASHIPTIQRFNKLLPVYFTLNFGKAGMEYLGMVTQGGCVKLSSDNARVTSALISEMEKIVSVFDRFWWFRKRTFNVRFRVHRFLGWLETLKQGGGDQLPPPDNIDYLAVFQVKMREELYGELNVFKSLLADSGQDTPARFVSMAAKCLQLIGQAAPDPTDLTVFDVLSTCNNLLRIYKEECIDKTNADSLLSKTERCDLLPEQILDPNRSKFSPAELVRVVRKKVSHLFYLLEKKWSKSPFHTDLARVLQSSPSGLETCPGEEATYYSTAITAAVQVIIQSILEPGIIFSKRLDQRVGDLFGKIKSPPLEPQQNPGELCLKLVTHADEILMAVYSLQQLWFSEVINTTPGP